MTANKSSKAAPHAGGGKVPLDVPDRCQSTSPPPILSASQGRCQRPLHSDSENSGKQSRYVRTDGRFLGHSGWSGKTTTLCSGVPLSDIDSHSRLTKSKSISCLDNKLSIFKPSAPVQVCQESQGNQEQKDTQNQGDLSWNEGLNGRPLSWSTLSLGPSTNQGHKRTLSLTRPVTGVPPTTIRKKISEWECRRVALPRMSLCLEKRPERVGGSEGCPSMLSSPCSEKTFDLKGIRRMSTAFSECSYTETEEEEAVSDKEGLGRFQKRMGKTEASGPFSRSLSARKETSAVLNRIQKIEQALKESPTPTPPRYLNNCYGPDKTKQRSFMIGGTDDLDSACTSKRSSICSVATEPDTVLVSDKLSKLRQRFSVSSLRSESPEPASPQSTGGTPVNPLPKPKRTFEYDANRSQKGVLSANGLPPNRASESPPPLPSTPAPSVTRTAKTEGSTPARLQDRESCESEDASLPSSYPSSPTENGTVSRESRSQPNSKSTLEENTYEDIVEKENPYEDVDPRGRSLGRKSCLLPESSRSWASMDRKLSSPPQLPSKPSSQSLRLSGPSDRKSHRTLQLSKRHSHDDMLLLPQVGVSPSPCGLLDDNLGRTSDTLTSHRHWRIPKLVQRINSIYCTKRGKKRLKKLSMSNIETPSLRGKGSFFLSSTAHTQRLLKLQSILRRAPSYRTLELQLIEWQERELFEYFVVVSLKKKPGKNSYSPEVTYQFPKLERPTKQMREAEQRLKAIPQFCYPDAKDWNPVSEYTSETFSFMLTGEDGSRRFGYCRRLLPSGKGPRLPEVYCVISRLGCFDLFSTILDEVERRRGISAALVYPFMRSLMESPFPAPGKTIKVKTFLPGAGNEVIELRRPMDSRLEHVDFDSLFSCLSVRQVIRVFASLLLERRVIFVADKLSTLSSCIHAVVALLYPFSWQHTFIPVLPGSMVDIVCCPTPFLVGLLSSSLPKLKELPVEEVLMVDLGTDRFIRQMEDEASLLPRKLQSALEQALEQRNDIINQDSDSESDEEYNTLNSLVSEAFIRFFLETIGHYSLFLTQNDRGERVFQRDAFRKSVASKSIRRFLGVFMESQMFTGFIQDRELRKCRAKGLFEQRVEQYLEELPDTEQSGVNKFLKGLGNKMKFLHKKS
uniref:DENN domain containing 2B n=1 Tax=Myripristis murdjan TaxID=586833 RepID=A0A668ANG1_9TELE